MKSDQPSNTCCRDFIPPRMRQEGKGVLPEISDDQIFCHRISALTFEQKPNGWFWKVRFPRTSVNCLLEDGHPEDVLLDNNYEEDKFSDWGILRADVGLVKITDTTNPDAGILQYRIDHDPKPCNYYHAEIRCYRQKSDTENTNPSKSMKTFFRVEVNKKLSIDKHVYKWPEV